MADQNNQDTQAAGHDGLHCSAPDVPPVEPNPDLRPRGGGKPRRRLVVGIITCVVVVGAIIGGLVWVYPKYSYWRDWGQYPAAYDLGTIKTAATPSDGTQTGNATTDSSASDDEVRTVSVKFSADGLPENCTYAIIQLEGCCRKTEGLTQYIMVDPSAGTTVATVVAGRYNISYFDVVDGEGNVYQAVPDSEYVIDDGTNPNHPGEGVQYVTPMYSKLTPPEVGAVTTESGNVVSPDAIAAAISSSDAVVDMLRANGVMTDAQLDLYETRMAQVVADVQQNTGVDVNTLCSEADLFGSADETAD